MRFPDDAPVTAPKREALRARIAALGLKLELVDEQAVRPRGPGGQKVNKTSSGVLLRCPLGSEVIAVRCARERQRSLNRFLALRELIEEIEARLFPDRSPRRRQIERIQKQKDRRRRRSSS